jgi:hypothetical protein
MLFKPLANASTLDHSSSDRATEVRTSCVEALWSPALVTLGSARGPFSLRRGLEFVQMYFKLSITFVPSLFLSIRLRNDEGDPVGSPSLEPLCRQWTSWHTSQRELSCRTNAHYRALGTA